MRTSRCTLALSALLLTLFSASVRPQATNQTVTAIDTRITYDGDWTVQDNGGHVFTSVAGSFALDFTGGAVYWYSRKLYNGAVAAITLDNDGAVYVDLSAGVEQSDTTVVAVLYAKDGLDVNESHRLNVTWDGPGSNGVASFLESYHIDFTSGESESLTSTSSSASSSSSSSSSASTSSSSLASTSGSSTASPSSLSSTSTSGLSPASTSGSSPASTSTSSPASTLGLGVISTSTLSRASVLGSSSASTINPSLVSPSSSSPASTSASTSALRPSKSNIGAIVGGVVGGVFIILVLVAALLCLRRRRSSNAARQGMQSATPFFLPRNPNPYPTVASLPSSPITKPPLDSDDQLLLPSQREQNRTYVLANPSNSTTLLSPESTAPLISLPIRESNSSSRFYFARNWKRLRSESISRTQGSTDHSPQEITASASTFVVGREYHSLIIPTTMTLPPLPPSSGVTDHQEALEDPPPVYRD